MFIGWIIEEREKGSRIERLMLLISSWKIESVEWLLSLIKMLDNNETVSNIIVTIIVRRLVRSMLNVTESGQHFVYSTLLSLTFPSITKIKTIF